MLQTTQSDDPFIDGERLPIGVDSLDMREPRGIPSGATVSILGDPRGMADLFLMHLIRTGRPTVYLTTVRTEQSIREELSAMGDGEAENLSIVETFAREEDLSEIVESVGDRIEVGCNLIVDSVSNLQGEEAGSLVDALRPAYQVVAEEDALAFLYFVASDVGQLSREERELLHLSDAVFDVETGTHNDKIETRLRLLKLRGCELPDDVIKFKVGECLRIDTSRDIA